MIRRLAPLLVGTLSVVAAACGGSGGPSMTSDAARQLGARDQAVHLALASGNRGTIDQTLVDLRRTVTTLEGQGQLQADRARAILAAADAVQADLVLLPTTTTTTTTTTTPAPPRHDHGGPNDGGGGGD